MGRARGRFPARRRAGRGRGSGAGRPRARRRRRERPGDPFEGSPDDHAESQRVQRYSRQRNLRQRARGLSRAATAARRVRPGSSPRPRYHRRGFGTVGWEEAVELHSVAVYSEKI